VDLYTWFRHAGSQNQGGECHSVGRHTVMSLMCWGFWKHECSYSGKYFQVAGLDADSHLGGTWYAEPKLGQT
jgi:hypothetical protein